jgi:hypothetical protein
MEQFKSDDSIAYSDTWVDDVYHKTVATKPSKNSPVKWVGTLTLDFEGCSEQDTREYAASRAIIEWQSAFRGKCHPKEKKDGTRAAGISDLLRECYSTEINMKERMATARKAADPMAMAQKAKSKMTLEQKKELMLSLVAELELAREDGDDETLIEQLEAEEAGEEESS